MATLIAGHSQVKYLNQFINDPHVTCISQPGSLTKELLHSIEEAVEFFQVSEIFIMKITDLINYKCFIS